jgi:hypothetical protein
MTVEDHIMKVYNDHPLLEDIDIGYAFTVIMYIITTLLRISEFVILGIEVMKFAATDKQYLSTYKVKQVIKLSRKLLAVLIPYVLIAFAVPAVAIRQELEYDKEVAPCYNHTEAIYIAHSCMHYLCFFCTLSVRIALVIATVLVREIWKKGEQDFRTRCPEIIDAETGISSDKYYADWNNTAERLQHWTNGYEETGKNAKDIIKIFETWFILPWIHFFIQASLDVNQVLQPWSNDSILAKTHYLLYNINQITTLLIPFLFVILINTYHDNFYNCMKRNFPGGYKDAGQKAIARTQFKTIEKEEGYNFVSHIIGTDIEIRVNGPLYAIFLLLGLFFTICKRLLN